MCHNEYMVIKRGYIVGGGILGMIVVVLIVQSRNVLALMPTSITVADTNPQVLSAETTETPTPVAPDPAGTPATETSQAASKTTAKARANISGGTPGSTSPATLVWEQDFSRTNSIDPAFWNIATSTLPIYNGEQQRYVNSTENVRIANGALILEAHKKTNGYTSGRIDTKGRRAIEVGSRVEARMKLPKGIGTWPAFWMLSGNQVHTSKLNPTDADWAKPRFYLWDGELDIMEAYGSLPGVLEATTHTYAKTRAGAVVRSDSSSVYHTYWMEWRADKLTFGVNNTIMFTHAKTSDAVSDWPFTADNKYYLILNLAMGGSGGGSIIQAAGDNWKLELASVKYLRLN